MPLSVLFLFRLLVVICDVFLVHHIWVWMWDGRPYKERKAVVESLWGSFWGVASLLFCKLSEEEPCQSSGVGCISGIFFFLSYSASYVKQNIGSDFQSMGESASDDRNIESKGWKVGLGWPWPFWVCTRIWFTSIFLLTSTFSPHSMLPMFGLY